LYNKNKNFFFYFSNNSSKQINKSVLVTIPITFKIPFSSFFSIGKQPYLFNLINFVTSTYLEILYLFILNKKKKYKGNQIKI
jgi:hypothetical protein